jgi:multidrug efflux pump subunit AcrA (membrane-fusion protein)
MKQDLTASASRRDPPQRRILTAEIIRIGAPVAILVAGFGLYVAMASMKRAPVREDQRAAVPLVETVVVQPHEGGLDFAVDGVVVPFREIDLAAEVSGRIAKRHEICRAGSYVESGTPLIEIDARDYELEVERLERELAQAAVSLKELEVECGNTQSLIKLSKEQHLLQRKELERQQGLASRKIVSDSDLDKSKREELVALNSVMTLDNQLQLLNTRRHRLESARDLWQSQLDKAQLDLARTKVAAPISGVIVQEMVQEDSYVQKGTSLAKLEDTSAVEVKCNLQMEDLYWLWSQAHAERDGAATTPLRDYQIPRTPVTVRYELAGQRYSWQGVLSRFDGIGIDERTRTAPCRVLVSEPRKVRVEGSAEAVVGPPALVRGMYVTVSVHAQPRMTLLEIPQRAIQPGNRVWQVHEGRLKQRQIRVADSTADVVLVYAEASGLEPGSKLVGSPLAMPADGMAVQERAVK